jgi:putative acetyltransferase
VPVFAPLACRLHQPVADPGGNSKTNSLSGIVEADPQGADALALLREAAIEARALYPELFARDAPWPDNPPTAGRGVYLVTYTDGKPVACGALRPIDAEAVEVRRLFVTAAARRRGLAQAMLLELERRAAALGNKVMRLETGNRQLAAIALYESLGFKRIPPFGPYAQDPLSVCFEKTVSPARGG